MVDDYTDMCPCSHWLCWRSVCVVVDYADTISAYSFTMLTSRTDIFTKTKNFVKPFLPVYMGPRWSFMMKKVSKSRDTVPLKWLCIALIPQTRENIKLINNPQFFKFLNGLLSLKDQLLLCNRVKRLVQYSAVVLYSKVALWFVWLCPRLNPPYS